MKKILFSILAVLFVSVNVASAQEENDETILLPTQLGKWMKPAPTKIAKIDSYIDACAAIYQEAMDIRAAYEAIEPIPTDLGTIDEASTQGNDVYKVKQAEYQAIIDRVENQQGAIEKLPEMAEAAVKSIPLGLKAITITKSITSTKDAIKLAIDENVSFVKAATKQIVTLSPSTVVTEEK